MAPSGDSAKQGKVSGIARAARKGAREGGGSVIDAGDVAQRVASASGDERVLRDTRDAVVRAVRSVGWSTNTPAFITRTAAAQVRRAGPNSADIMRAALGSIAGSIDAATEMRVDEECAGKAAAIGVIEGAGEVGRAEFEQIKQLVTSPIGGITPLRPEYFEEGRRQP